MKNKTTLVIAHRISTIKDSNLIIVMEEGQIVEAGSYEELLNQKGYFYRLERGEVKWRVELTLLKIFDFLNNYYY